jgi:AP-3 complex subunit beta
MKLLLAMLSKGNDIPEFFPDVVKNVVVKNIEVKKMVYIYLVHYADYDSNCREIALLSINSFQKDMSGTNQLIRGLALRVMTSIRVQDIIQIQLLAVRKCSTDTSPYVRKCAATALTKIFLLDKEQIDHLKLILEKLLKDSSTMVLGSAMAAFNEICPTSYDILHRSYRKLCHLLADMDEWTQVFPITTSTRLSFVCLACLLLLYATEVLYNKQRAIGFSKIIQNYYRWCIISACVSAAISSAVPSVSEYLFFLSISLMYRYLLLR